MRKVQTASAAFLLSFFLLTSVDSVGQSSQDFWSALTECTLIQEFQGHYPTVGQGQVQLHTVMDHGVEIPDLANVTMVPGINFQVFPKPSVLANDLSEFFLIHEYNIDGATASFNLIYYYDFDGSYETFKSAKVELQKSDNEWSVTNYSIN